MFNSNAIWGVLVQARGALVRVFVFLGRSLLILAAMPVLWLLWEVPEWRVYASLGLLILFIVVLWKLPQWQADSWIKRGSREDLAKLEEESRKTLAQVIGGLALLGGLYFTWMTVKVSQEGQITERFTKAIEQLGATDGQGGKKLEVRLGGIYALERIARDSERDHWPIMEVLTTYVRENAPWKEDETPEVSNKVLPNPSEHKETKDQSPPKLSADIQAILTVVGRRVRTYEKGEEERLNLSNTDLRGANLVGAHLEGANLGKAHLERANLGKAHLEGAILWKAHLERAYLGKAHLEGATLWEAHLEGADLREAHLEGATFWKAHLERADLRKAHLEGADLRGVRDLTQEQVKSSITDEHTKLGPHPLIFLIF